MKQKIFRILANLKFAILLLLGISFFSILGTIIEQDQTVEFYKLNYPISKPILGILSWTQIIFFGLDHIYQTWWFICLIFLFACSLILCSILQQLPLLKIARRCQFIRDITTFSKLELSTKSLNTSFFITLISNLLKNNYSLFHQKKIIYCYKGINGRIGPIIVHFSMILILSGILVSSLFGFKGQELIPKTEVFHIQNLINSGTGSIIPNISGRINDFWIIYNNKSISQFYSNISILNKKSTEIKQQTISVNYPLIYNNIYYYQTDWDLIGLQFQQNKEYPLIKMMEISTNYWLTWISKLNSAKQTQGFIILINNLEGYCSFYNSQAQFLGNLELNETISLPDNYLLTLSDIIITTGLQIKKDPGIQIIYFGFFFLMVSTLMSYLTYSQIWLLKKYRIIFIGGTTNRAQLEFFSELFKIVK